ncbi:unnamed protein product [Paramecium primaurelia]|uniref:Uncharacterized protein n=1 Tax=Paramecium primaurelia TaxID=5886 RepID=A0A8S1M431_PARPR|nr:unnamed protein product [Paramecium primaurelia]
MIIIKYIQSYIQGSIISLNQVIFASLHKIYTKVNPGSLHQQQGTGLEVVIYLYQHPQLLYSKLQTELDCFIQINYKKGYLKASKTNNILHFQQWLIIIIWNIMPIMKLRGRREIDFSIFIHKLTISDSRIVNKCGIQK